MDSAWAFDPIRVAAPNPVGSLSTTTFAVVTAITPATAYSLVSQYDSGVTVGVSSLPSNPGVAASPPLSSYDVTYSTTCVDAACTLARLRFNGETVGLVSLGLVSTAAYTTVGVRTWLSDARALPMCLLVHHPLLWGGILNVIALSNSSRLRCRRR